jgi:DNA-binding MarR family transcriptional regulator
MSSARGEPRADVVRADLFRHVLGMMGDTKDRVLAIAGEDGLAASQVNALVHLSGSLSQRELAARMQVDASNVTDIVDRLEARGFAARTVDPLDRRVRRITITPDGEKVRRKIVEQALSESPINRLDDAEQRQLLDLLAKIIDPIELPDWPRA